MEAADASNEIRRLAKHPKFCVVRPMIQDLDDDNWMLCSALDPAFQDLIELDLTFDALVFPHHLKQLHRTAADMVAIANNTSALSKLPSLATEAEFDWRADTPEPYVELF